MIGQLRHVARVPGLGQGVLQEGRMGFFGLGDSELRLRDDFHGKKSANLTQLPRIA